MPLLLNADLLFIRGSKQKLSNLISKSTKLSGINYTHIAILEKYQNELFIIHSTNKKGCIRQRFLDFINDQEADIDIYRSKKELQNPKLIISSAKKMIGQPYNASFRAEQPGFYCSELVCYAFDRENLFYLTPMSFGPNKTILPEWQEYYRKLNLDIPNGEMGSSPNSLIRQGNLQFIMTIKKDTLNKLLVQNK